MKKDQIEELLKLILSSEDLNEVLDGRVSVLEESGDHACEYCKDKKRMTPTDTIMLKARVKALEAKNKEYVRFLQDVVEQFQKIVREEEARRLHEASSVEWNLDCLRNNIEVFTAELDRLKEFVRKVFSFFPDTKTNERMKKKEILVILDNLRNETKDLYIG